MDRNLDEVYFRVKRDGKWGIACFSDLTPEERFRQMEGRGEDWLMEMCNILADTLKKIGDEFDIVGG